MWTHAQLIRYVPVCVKPEKLEAGKAELGDRLELEEGKRTKLLEERPKHSLLLKPMGVTWERNSRAHSHATALEGPDGVNRNEYLFAEFALTLLCAALKRDVLNPKELVVRQMLNPYVPLLRQLLFSKHDDVVVLSLRSLSLLLKADLPSLTSELPWILKTIFFLLQRAGNTSSLTSQGCFKAITAVLRIPRYAKLLTQSQLKILLSFAREDITEVHRQAVAFGLIKSIVERRLVCVEVYDVMDSISEHMITAQSDQMRTLCSHSLIQFLLDYPLGEKRMNRHISFMVENLEYEYEEGRKAVLELMDRYSSLLSLLMVSQYQYK